MIGSGFEPAPNRWLYVKGNLQKVQILSNIFIARSDLFWPTREVGQLYGWVNPFVKRASHHNVPILPDRHTKVTCEFAWPHWMVKVQFS